MIDVALALPTIEGTRVRLRALGDADAPGLLAVFGDSEVVRYWSTPPLLADADALQLVAQSHVNARAGTGLRWAIARRDDDRCVGTCSLFRIDAENGRAEVGFALGRAQWGQGLAHEAIGLAIAHAFGVLDLRRLEADVDPRNAASLRVLERHGFAREGYLRERFLVAGELQDSVVLGLLRREWVARIAGSPS